VIADRHARYFGAELNERSLVAGNDAELGKMRFDDWLGRTAHSIPDPQRQLPLGAGATNQRAPLKEDELRVSDVPSGSVLLLGDVAVFSVEGGFCATQASCTHWQAPLSDRVNLLARCTCEPRGAMFR
jgi:hypothetical protein